MSEITYFAKVRGLLERLSSGDAGARDELISLSIGHLQSLTSRMLNEHQRLRPYLESGDVFQDAVMRLRRSLEGAVPSDPKQFLQLAAENIRRELRDLCRKYFGRRRPDGSMPPSPARSPANVAAQEPDEAADPDAEAFDGGPDLAWEPAALAQWTEFHDAVEAMSDDDRRLFDLLFYQELTQAEAAEILAVDKSTVKRRWRSACRKLAASVSMPDASR